MNRERKSELLQRSLGLRHKLKVIESMKVPETHEEMTVSLLSKWELEDELQAVEELLEQARRNNIEDKKALLLEEGVVGMKKRNRSLIAASKVAPGLKTQSKSKAKKSRTEANA